MGIVLNTQEQVTLLCTRHEIWHKFGIYSGIYFGTPWGWVRRSDHRMVEYAPYGGIFRHADPRLLSDCLGGCLQVELPHGG